MGLLFRVPEKDKYGDGYQQRGCEFKPTKDNRNQWHGHCPDHMIFDVHGIVPVGGEDQFTIRRKWRG